MRALGGQEVLQRHAHLVAHQHRIAARGAQLHAVLVEERRAEQLAQELADAPPIRGPDRARHPVRERTLAQVSRLAAAQPERSAQRLCDQREGRPGAHRIAAADPHLRRGRTRREPPEELVPQA